MCAFPKTNLLGHQDDRVCSALINVDGDLGKSAQVTVTWRCPELPSGSTHAVIRRPNRPERPSANSSGRSDAANEEVTAVHGGEELFFLTWPAFVNLFEDALGTLDWFSESELLTGAEARATTPRNLQLRS